MLKSHKTQGSLQAVLRFFWERSSKRCRIIIDVKFLCFYRFCLDFKTWLKMLRMIGGESGSGEGSGTNI